MRCLFSTVILYILLLRISSPAFGCGLYGFHPQVQKESDPWVPLISFAVIIFGCMFAGRSLSRISQGIIMGVLFALASALGVFSISILYYPEAYMAKMLLIPVILIAAIYFLGFRTKQELWGLGKFGFGIVAGAIFYLPMSNYIPNIKTKTGIEWVSTHSPTTTNEKSSSANQHPKRPSFATKTQEISERARKPSETNENRSRDKHND